MTSKLLSRTVLGASALCLAASPIALTAAQAQGYGPPPPGYDQQQQGYNQGPPPPPPGYYQQQQPQPGYDQSQPAPGYGQPDQPPPGYGAPPPPPGYAGGPESPQQQAQDQRYAAYAQAWSRDNCVRHHADVGGSAVIGGLLGAALGASVSGNGHRGDGAALGAALGAGTGAVVASSRNDATSPGCPPGYVVRDGAPAFGYNGPVVYAAPTDYQPWVFYDNAWVYRPYPYHDWYYHHYYRGDGGGYYHHHRHW